MTDTTERPDVQSGIEIDPTAEGEQGGRYPFGIPYGWFQVGWSDDVAAGDVLPRYYFGRDLALWRDEQGVAHLNDAFCPHLGALRGVSHRASAPFGRCRGGTSATPRP